MIGIEICTQRLISRWVNRSMEHFHRRPSRPLTVLPRIFILGYTAANERPAARAQVDGQIKCCSDNGPETRVHTRITSTDTDLHRIWIMHREFLPHSGITSPFEWLTERYANVRSECDIRPERNRTCTCVQVGTYTMLRFSGQAFDFGRFLPYVALPYFYDFEIIQSRAEIRD